MSAFLQQIFELITTNPGNLAYHLVLAFSIVGALQASLGQLQSRLASHRRLVAGLGILLVLRLSLFLMAALSWQGVMFAPHHLPPLDRLVNLLSLIAVIWLWIFPKPTRLGDAATGLLGLLALTLFGIAMVWWNQYGPALNYNGAWLDIYGEIFAVLLLAAGIFGLVILRPVGWGIGLGMLGLLSAGHIAHLLAPLPPGDFPGAVRLTQMAAFPLLFTLPQRFSTLLDTTLRTSYAPDKSGAGAEPPSQIGLNDCLSFLTLAAHPEASNTLPEITRVAAGVMDAKVCLLAALSDQPDLLNLKAGYIQPTWEKLDEAAISGQMIETIVSSIKRGRSVRLPASAAAHGATAFEGILPASMVGSLLAAPFKWEEHASPHALILLTPVSGREWSPEDQAQLSAIAEHLGRNLQANKEAAASHLELDRLRSYISTLQSELDRVTAEGEDLTGRLETVRREAAREKERAASLAALVAGHDEALAATARLAAEYEQNKAKPEEAKDQSSEVDHLEKELRLALQEIAHLKKDLSQADIKLLELQGEAQVKAKTEEEEAKELDEVQTEQFIPVKGKQVLPPVTLEGIASISQELRQPMASIVGYTDLLLGESVGILGALQRKFLERVKISTERMSSLVEELVQITDRKNGSPPIVEAVDLNSVIDEAMIHTLTQMQEKNVILRVDIPNQLPPINADRDALQQIIIHLLQNATSATPEEGEIRLNAQVREENGRVDYVLLQVADTGAGIPSEEFPRLFSRFYRAENPAIKGVGDPGIGLSIVKSLVEALGGRIWVDSAPGKGSTFSVLLPISLPSSPKGAGEQS
jgi:nitrogen-specific signal transduction histidine kinase